MTETRASHMQALPPVFWINLDRSTARAASMRKQLDQRDLTHTRIRAVDGNHPELVSKTVRCANLSAPEAATLASHLLAIQTALHAGCGEALILEDDTSFEFWDRAQDVWADLRGFLPPNYGAVQLCVAEEPKELHRLYTQTPPALRWRSPGYWSTGAYLIDRVGMTRVMNHCRSAHGSLPQFDVTRFPPSHVADQLLLRLVNEPEQESEIAGPWVARVPIFLIGADSSEVHADHAGHQRRAYAYTRYAQPLLAKNAYSRWSLAQYIWSTRLRTLTKRITVRV